MPPRELLRPNDGREGARGPVEWRVAARIIDPTHHHWLAWCDAIDPSRLTELRDVAAGCVAHYGQRVTIKLRMVGTDRRKRPISK